VTERKQSLSSFAFSCSYDAPFPTVSSSLLTRGITGVMVEVAFNGAEAVRKLNESETSFDVCLMDVWLDTSMSGLDVARFIRDRFGVLFLHSSSSPLLSPSLLTL
jgi:CheY-like chemotaxis protein